MKLNLEEIKILYNTLSTNDLSKYCKVSIPTMINYLKNNNIYQFRKNYNKLIT